MNNIKIIFIFVLLGFFSNSYSQTSLKNVSSIESNYQKCLDQGGDMLGCSNKYYFFCDKLLNEVYQTIRTKLDKKTRIF